MTEGRENARVEPVWAFLCVAVAILSLGFIADSKTTQDHALPLDARIQNAIAVRADRTNRPLTEEQANALRETFIDNEALVGEAKDLGLDRGDHIVRRRLAQKRRALLRPNNPVEDSVPDEAPTTGIARHSFRHIFLAQPKGTPPDSTRLAEVKDALADGAEWSSLGDPFIRGRRFTAVDAADIGRVFGPEFNKSMSEVELDVWSPVQSTYGTHLVRVDARTHDIQKPDKLRASRAATTANMRQDEQRLLDTLRREHPIHREPPPKEQP